MSNTTAQSHNGSADSTRVPIHSVLIGLGIPGTVAACVAGPLITHRVALDYFDTPNPAWWVTAVGVTLGFGCAMYLILMAFDDDSEFSPTISKARAGWFVGVTVVAACLFAWAVYAWFGISDKSVNWRTAAAFAAWGGTMIWIPTALLAWKFESAVVDLEDAETQAAQETLLTTRSFGKPGRGLGLGSKFGTDNAELGSYGERTAATLLEDAVPDDSHARFFHGLWFPGSTNADVDHAVVIGHKVLLIDTKVWKVGSYGWGRYGEIVRDGQQFKGGDNHMDAAVDGYAQNLYGFAGDMPVEVEGHVLLLAPPDAKTGPNVTGPRQHETIHLQTVDTMIERIRELVADQADSPQVYPHLIGQLQAQLY